MSNAERDGAQGLGTMVAQLSAPGRQVRIGPGWMQGRTAFGGLTTALALAAARAELPGLPALRSVHCAFVRPLGGEARFDARLIRQGRSAAFVAAEALSGEEVAARLTMTFGAARDSRHDHDHAAAAPARGPRESLTIDDREGAPAFLGNFDMRWAAGDRLVSGSDRPDITLWARLRDAGGLSGEVALLACADSPPPAAMVGFTQPAPISTITWAIDIARAPAPDAWIGIRSRSLQAAEGYSLQRMDFFDEAGATLASGQQLVALFD